MITREGLTRVRTPSRCDFGVGKQRTKRETVKELDTGLVWEVLSILKFIRTRYNVCLTKTLKARINSVIIELEPFVKDFKKEEKKEQPTL